MESTKYLVHRTNKPDQPNRGGCTLAQWYDTEEEAMVVVEKWYALEPEFDYYYEGVTL